MQAFILNLLNTDFVLALVIGAIVSYLVKWLATSQGMQWKKWEGLAITAVKMAEVAIPDDVANKGAKRMDEALRIFLEKYEKATGVSANEKDVAEITSLLSLIHDNLESKGNMPDAPATGGFIGMGCLLPLGLIGLLMLGTTGCLTRTRCLQQSFADCTFVVNEPTNLENPSYPRSLQIGVQDQQVEGGTDTIASGNKTDPSLQVPMGDTALGAIGSWMGGLVKGASAAAAPAAAATTTTAPACPAGGCVPTP